LIHRPPLGFGSIGACPQRVVRRNQGKVRHCDHATPRISPNISKGIKLLQVNIGDSCFFSQLPQCRLIEILVFKDETSWNRELPLKWGRGTLHQQDSEGPRLDRENYDVNGNSHRRFSGYDKPGTLFRGTHMSDGSRVELQEVRFHAVAEDNTV
jgi:hypothetical protein